MDTYVRRLAALDNILDELTQHQFALDVRIRYGRALHCRPDRHDVSALGGDSGINISRQQIVYVV
ncbi:hypothetical protein, partial [Pseudomonas syringae group genomosp. 7]|uniref:hypothetical protein n=1 Tax=Pseudomonas syringae group genomosp. 7 TaxID=251699 RepID=UPI00376FFC3A